MSKITNEALFNLKLHFSLSADLELCLFFQWERVTKCQKLAQDMGHPTLQALCCVKLL
jgi:hypothetical protein